MRIKVTQKTCSRDPAVEKRLDELEALEQKLIDEDTREYNKMKAAVAELKKKIEEVEDRYSVFEEANMKKRKPLNDEYKRLYDSTKSTTTFLKG
jgi:hypothetical protein